MISYMTQAPWLHLAQQLRSSSAARRTASKKKPIHNFLDSLDTRQHPVSKNKMLVQILEQTYTNERKTILVISFKIQQHHDLILCSLNQTIELFSWLVSISASKEYVYHQHHHLSHRVMYWAWWWKWLATLPIGKSHQPLHATLDYHDTQHRIEYITLNMDWPCVLPTKHSTFHMDKTDNTLAQPVVWGQKCRSPVIP
jgi:hypothetical protein